MFVLFINATATTEISTLSLHDALPIWPRLLARTGRVSRTERRRDERRRRAPRQALGPAALDPRRRGRQRPARELRRDRKSTRLNSSHAIKSYAVFFLDIEKLRSALQ